MHPRLISIILFFSVIVAGCESDNENFCARYQYVYKQLLADDLPDYSEMKQQLMINLVDPKKDEQQAKFMLFVLEDWYSDLKPIDEPVVDFCLRIKRWQAYP
jgi:hypothetical protein